MTKAQIVLDGDIGPLRQKLREATANINAFGRDSTAAMRDTLAPATALQAKIVGIATAITSGAFAAFVKTSVDIQDSMSKAAAKAGVTTEQFSGMAYAARLADVEVEDLSKTYTKLSTLLTNAQAGQKDAVDTLRRLKIDPSSIKDADELLLALADRFGSMEEGAGRTGLAVDLFGEKLGPKLIPLLAGGRQGIEELRAEAQRLGVVVDTETGKKAEEFNDTLTRLQTQVQGIGLGMAKELLPVLQAVAGALTDTGKEATGAGVATSALRVIFETLAVLGANVVYVFRQTGNEIGAIAAQIAALGRGDIAGFWAISEAVKEDAARARAELEAFERRVMQQGEFAPGASPAPGGKPGRSSDPPPKPPPAAEKSQMAALEGRLAEEKRVAAILDQGREYSKERELAFWRDVLATVKLSSADRVAVMKRTATLEVDIAQKAAADRRALDAEQIAGSERLALAKLDAEQAAAQQLVDLGQISTLQKLQLDQQYETQRYEIQRAALMQRLQLLADDPTTTPAARERLNNELLLLEMQHQRRLIELQGKQAGKGEDKTIFGGDADSLFGGMQDSFGQGLQQMLTRARNWRQAMGGIFTSTGAIFIQEMVTKPVAQYIAGLARQFAADNGFLASKKATEAAASGSTVAIKSAETTAVVGMNAAQAGTGAAASVAPTPFVGPMLALAAMAAVFAAVMAMGSRKSAAGGYDIPSGVNPMTQLHEEEMVLPKHIANPLRAALSGAGADGSGSVGGGDPMVIRARSMDDLISVRDLARTMRKAKRDFVITRRDAR